MTIVKVRRSMVTSEEEVQWLIYDKDRKHMEELPDRLIPNYVRAAMGDDHKAFFNAAWSSIVGWALSDRVGDQTW